MLHRNAVREARTLQRERGHVQIAVELTESLERSDDVARQQRLDEVASEAVVTGRDRRVRGEDASRPHGTQVAMVLQEQRRNDQRRVALVHVVARDVAAGGRVDDRLAGDPQHRFLGQTVAAVAAVEGIGEGAVPGLVPG